MKPVKLFVLLISILVSTAGLSQTDRDMIIEKSKAFSQAYMDGNTQALVGIYTAKGKIMPTGTDILEGKEALTKYWQSSPDNKVLHHQVVPIELTVEGDVAYDYGYYEGSSQYKDNPVSEWGGKYVIIWKKIDGEWLMDIDMWNKRAPSEKPKPSDNYLAVEAACYNYIDCFYNADTTLAYQSVDPSLRKVGWSYKKDDGKYSEQKEMTFESLIDLSKNWNKSEWLDKTKAERSVRVIEVSDKIAVAKVTAMWGIDYMSLAKKNNTWKIMNVIWQSKPR